MTDWTIAPADRLTDHYQALKASQAENLKLATDAPTWTDNYHTDRARKIGNIVTELEKIFTTRGLPIPR